VTLFRRRLSLAGVILSEAKDLACIARTILVHISSQISRFLALDLKLDRFRKPEPSQTAEGE